MSHLKNISEKRLVANRANAQKSTGPRTAEGKAASSQNAVKHGFRAHSFAVVRLEELDEVASLKADAMSFYNPVNAQELIAVERIALAQQQIFRAARLEAGLFTASINEAWDPRDQCPITPMCPELVGIGDIQIARAQNRNFAVAQGFRKLANESKVWQAFLRYQSQAERLYRRAVEEFDRLRARRNEIPNEPTSLTQPEDNEPLPPVSEINGGWGAPQPSPSPAPKSSNPGASAVVYPNQEPDEQHEHQRHLGRSSQKELRQRRSGSRNRLRGAIRGGVRSARAQRRG